MSKEIAAEYLEAEMAAQSAQGQAVDAQDSAKRATAARDELRNKLTDAVGPNRDRRVYVFDKRAVVVEHTNGSNFVRVVDVE